MDLCTVLYAALDIFEALAALHDMGMAHGDLKPENVLVSEEGAELKLCDFDGCTFQGVHATHPATMLDLITQLSSRPWNRKV